MFECITLNKYQFLFFLFCHFYHFCILKYPWIFQDWCPGHFGGISSRKVAFFVPNFKWRQDGIDPTKHIQDYMQNLTNSFLWASKWFVWPPGYPHGELPVMPEIVSTDVNGVPPSIKIMLPLFLFTLSSNTKHQVDTNIIDATSMIIRVATGS